MPAEFPEVCDPLPFYSKLTTQMHTTTIEVRENEQESKSQFLH